MKHPDTVYLLDASIYFFRAWFGMPDYFHDNQGRPLNGVYGYLKTLLSHISPHQPSHMVAAFDESLFSGFRHQLYPQYKANRALPDESLSYQLILAKTLTEQLGIPCLGSDQYEADDLIAWGAYSARSINKRCVIISRDKDLAQLVMPGDTLLDWVDDSQQNHDNLQQKWGIALDEIPDLLALIGDTVDNIPGIAGIGAKTATALIQHFGSLDQLYQNLDDIQTLPLRGTKRIQACLQGTEEQALLYRQLIRLHYPETPLAETELATQPIDAEGFKLLLGELGLGKAFDTLAEKYL